MKKVFILIVCGLLFTQLAFADNKYYTTDTTQLPVAAREFIKKHFVGVGVSNIKIEKDFMEGKTYDVVLTNGFDLDFNAKGEWKEVDGQRTEIPSAILPVKIADYVKKNYPQNVVVSIDKNRDGYDVKLSGGLELEFDRSENFIRIDH